jgi:NDP-sugar pyrophosphorylase family protein
MKAVLICPISRPAVPNLTESDTLATLPILGDSLVNHWIEHLAIMGAKEITIIAPRCAELVSASTGDGARWGVSLNIIAPNVEPTVDEAVSQCSSRGSAGWLTAPFDVVSMTHLPGNPALPLFDSYASWFAAVSAWMPKALTPMRIRMSEARPGIWISSRAKISPSARLIAPCWIGDQAIVEDNATIGPEAILEDRAVVDEKATVAYSWVSPDTFVGRMTSVMRSLALGPTLISWESDSSLRVRDPFLLGSLKKTPEPVPAKAPAHARPSQLGFLASLRSRLIGG